LRQAAPASGFPVSSVFSIRNGFSPYKQDKCVNEINFSKEAKLISNLLNTTPVNMPRPVQADFLIFVYLYDPTILDHQGNCPETN
jgi:hypothetical protein